MNGISTDDLGTQTQSVESLSVVGDINIAVRSTNVFVVMRNDVD